MLLGIGSSGPQVSEGWHGVRFAKQLQRTREYIEVVRMALARERVEFHGETIDLPLPDGPGKALKLTIAPVQERIPIYLAAIGPKNTALAGEIADGWIPTLLSPEHLPELRESLEEGAREGGPLAGRLRHRADGERVRHRRPRRRARLDAPVHRAVRRRHGLARQELLQPARAALRLRGRGPRDPGPLPRGQARRGDGGAARRADRPRVALRARGPRARPAARLPRRGRRDAGHHADWRGPRRAASSSCGWSPSWPADGASAG